MLSLRAMQFTEVMWLRFEIALWTWSEFLRLSVPCSVWRFFSFMCDIWFLTELLEAAMPASILICGSFV